MTTAEKIVLHEKFWKGEGPSLLFIPQNDGLLYDMTDYVNRFHDPRLMWEGETARSRSDSLLGGGRRGSNPRPSEPQSDALTN